MKKTNETKPVTEAVGKTKKLPLLLGLFLTFFKIGLFTFGGGYAMISIISDNCVEKKKWITHDEMMNVTIIAESTPGPISINCATYVGYRQAGIIGGICTTLGVVLPSFIIIYAISQFLDNFLEYKLIANAFSGIKIAVGFLILEAAIKMIKKMDKKPLTRVLMIASCVVMTLVTFLSWNFSSISLMLICAVISVAVFLIGQLSGKNKKGGEGK